MNKIAVVLLNLGGPDSLDAVEPFLKNLFGDKDIFKLPFGQKLFAKIIARRRAPKVCGQYKLIGGKSPINEWTEKQRQMLEKTLREEINSADVFTAMRYWKPLTAETAKKVEAGGYDKIVLLPLYPHYSFSTTVSSFNEWNYRFKGDKSKIIYIDKYFDNDKYLVSINQRIDEAILKFDENERSKILLVFSAHGTPVSMVNKGDPYSSQIRETVKLLMNKRKNDKPHRLCFQSKVSPVKWLEPSTEQTIKDAAEKGFKNLLIVPISFVSDHIETLYELDVLYRRAAENYGIENYTVMQGLNDSEKFIESLKEITLNSLKEKKNL